jgi:predicted nucleic acid-binding protein
MPLRVGLDTSFVLGLIDDQDLWHSQAHQLQGALEAAPLQTYIFDCVLAEVVSALARRTHEKRRSSGYPALFGRLRARFPAKTITWLYLDLPTQFDEVLALVEDSAGELNFNDALIAISCRKRAISFIASFDADFDSVDYLKRLSQPSDLTGEQDVSNSPTRPD